MSNHWESKRIIDLLGKDSLFTDGDWIESKDQDQNGSVRLIQLADIQDGHFDQRSAKFMTSKRSEELRTTKLQAGDLLIARMPDPIGRSCIFPGAYQECVTVVDVAVIRTNQCDKKWLMYLLNSIEIRRQIESKATGTTRTRISRGELGNIKLKVPSIPEQQKIAKILTGIDKYISLINLNIEKLHFLFCAQRQKFLEKQSQWNQYKISDIADPSEKYSLTGGPFGSDLKTSDYTESGIRIIQLQNIEDSNFNDKNKIYTSLEKASSLMSSNIFGGDLIIAKMGDPVAKCTSIPNDLSRCLMSSDGIRLKVDQKRFDNFFIELSINSPYFRKKTNEISTGSTRQRIGLQEFRNLTIACPHLNEQRKISQILSSIKNLTNVLDNKKIILNNLKIGFISDLLTGQTRVNV